MNFEERVRAALIPSETVSPYVKTVANRRGTSVTIFTPRIFKQGHGSRAHASLEERFMARVEKSGPNGCWLWLGALDPGGYGRFVVYKNRTPKGYRAHRWAMEFIVGRPLIGDDVVDHTCRVRHCVNPDHLQVVSHAENVSLGHRRRREAHGVCPQGHEGTEQWLESGVCEICARASTKAWRMRNDTPERRERRASEERERRARARATYDVDVLLTQFHKSYEIDGDCWIWAEQFRDGVPVFPTPRSSRPAKALWWIYSETVERIGGRRGYSMTCQRTDCVNPDHSTLN